MGFVSNIFCMLIAAVVAGIHSPANTSALADHALQSQAQRSA
jgi:hypothetical protein